MNSVKGSLVGQVLSYMYNKCGGFYKSRWSGSCKSGLSYIDVEGDLHVKVVVGVLQGDPLTPAYNVEGSCKSKCCKATL